MPRPDIEDLYLCLLDAWNRRDADAMADCFHPTGIMIGFDGSTEVGPDAIAAHLAPIFRDHPTAAYVHIVENIVGLAADVSLLRASAGMVPPGKTQLNAAANVNQCLVARRDDGGWRAELFQNTPAAFHGRPELVETMTARLQAVLDQSEPERTPAGGA